MCVCACCWGLATGDCCCFCSYCCFCCFDLDFYAIGGDQALTLTQLSWIVCINTRSCRCVCALAVIKSKPLIESTAKCPRTHILKSIRKCVCVCMCILIYFVWQQSEVVAIQLVRSGTRTHKAILDTSQAIHKRSASLKLNATTSRASLLKSAA